MRIGARPTFFFFLTDNKAIKIVKYRRIRQLWILKLSESASSTFQVEELT